MKNSVSNVKLVGKQKVFIEFSRQIVGSKNVQYKQML